MDESFWEQLQAGVGERFSGFETLMPFRVQ